MGLLFKARSQDIQGKPRVYFSAEATDYSRYMEPICEEILKYQNCCIWYPEPETDRSAKDFLDDLSDMQLLVIPVTSNLIFHPSGNVKREFDLATARHIPVLPIMVEDDLSEPFNRIFGELQYLDRYKVDETAIRYEEKLEKFLSSVLVGDELAAKVRAAFDAYVFLSYRKKDRKYAQELMRLIHKNEFCRDIAIWYDEFLAPGENFNDAIRDALRKSELFVLTVTPNLVNELNYIVTTEYPLAKSENKTIVPAELVATDRAQLAEIFADLPDCTDAHDDAQLSATLLSALAGVAVRENDGDAEHNFFIGLAYLSGIDVEINHARALRLITESAEAGLLEAMDQLVRMYRSGTGVPRDGEKALYWQERKITTLRSCYDSVPTKESFEALVEELLNCGDSYTETNQPSRCMALYEEALILSRKADYPAVGFREAAALRSMGHYVLTFEQDGQRARALVEESVTAGRKLHEEQNGEKSKRSLATGLYFLGDLCRQIKDMVGARNYTEESEQLFADLYKEYGLEEDQEFLMSVRDVLCLLYYKRQDLWNKALEYAKESLAYCENEAADKKTARAKYNLSVSYSRLDDVYRRAPRSIMLDYFTDRKEACQRSYDIAKELCEEDPSPSNKRSLSISCQKLAKLTETFDGYDQALCQEAVRLLREVFDASPTARAKADFAYILIWACSGPGDYLPNYLRATELREELVRELGTEESKHTLSQTYQKLAKEYQKQTSDPQDPWHYVPYDQAPAAYDKVEEYYQKSIRILEELSSRSSEGKYLDDLAYTYKKLGDVYSSAGRKQEAQAAMRTSISVYEKQYRMKESAFVCQSLLSQCSHEMGPYGCLSSTSEERLAYLQLCHNAANEYKYLNTKWKPGGVGFDPIAEAVQTDLEEKLTHAEDSAERARLHLSLARLNFYWERYEKAEWECMCAQELVKGSREDAMLRISIQALELRGDMYLACNRVQSPRDCYTEALRLAQDRSAEEASDDVIRLLKKSGDAFLTYLDLKLDLGEFDAPGSELVHVLEQKNEKATHFKYDPHGEINRMYDKARECYQSALSLLVGQKDMASLRRMGEIHSTLVGLAPSAGLCQYHRQETVEIFQQIHDRMPMSVKAKMDLIEALLAAGRYDASIPGAIRAPKEYLDHALYVADELDKLEYSPDIKNALGDIYFVIGDTYRMEFQDDAIAQSAYHRGISAYATVHEDDKRISTGNQLADAYFHYMHAYPKDAGVYSDEAIRVLRDLHENNLDDLSCAEKYFRACLERDCLSQEMNYLIEKAHKAHTIEGYITLARQCRAVAQFASSYQRKAEFFRHAYEVMTGLPKDRLDEKGLMELEDAIHNARAFKEYHPYLFKDEEPDA